ncbi:uncharacterized protein VTP21DRAFT_1251 [Calcarisporiella thermophila]|uniref:uncharacterized protein n=1 Tax=Calcarisporiella thermophila TaxID=911321 RepID=UPI003743CE8D
MEKSKSPTVSFILYIPIIVCLISIAIILWVRWRNRLRNQAEEYNDDEDVAAITTAREDLSTGVHRRHTATDANEEELGEIEENEHEDNNAGEGSSSTTRVRKLGKKRAAKMQRKEEQRRYHEYLMLQREQRRAQDEVVEEEFRRRKEEEAERLAKELEKKRAQQEKLAKQQEAMQQKLKAAKEKEELKLQKQMEKALPGLLKLIKSYKRASLSDLADSLRISRQNVLAYIDVLESRKLLTGILDEEQDTYVHMTPEEFQAFADFVSTRGRVTLTELSKESGTILGIEDL